RGRAACAARSRIEPCDEVLDGGEERGGGSAVDRAVVERETRLHGGPSRDGAIGQDDRALADAADPEDTALRGARDRGRDSALIDPAVRDGEGAVRDFAGGQRAVPR